MLGQTAYAKRQGVHGVQTACAGVTRRSPQQSLSMGVVRRFRAANRDKVEALGWRADGRLRGSQAMRRTRLMLRPASSRRPPTLTAKSTRCGAARVHLELVA